MRPRLLSMSRQLLPGQLRPVSNTPVSVSQVLGLDTYAVLPGKMHLKNKKKKLHIIDQCTKCEI